MCGADTFFSVCREQEKVDESVRRLQQSEGDYLQKNEKLKMLNSEKYKEVQNERQEKLAFRKDDILTALPCLHSFS